MTHTTAGPPDAGALCTPTSQALAAAALAALRQGTSHQLRAVLRSGGSWGWLLAYPQLLEPRKGLWEETPHPKDPSHAKLASFRANCPRRWRRCLSGVHREFLPASATLFRAALLREQPGVVALLLFKINGSLHSPAQGTGV